MASVASRLLGDEEVGGREGGGEMGAWEGSKRGQEATERPEARRHQVQATTSLAPLFTCYSKENGNHLIWKVVLFKHWRSTACPGG